MKIVITAATGHIGRHLCQLLDYSKNEIVLITRDASKLQEESARGATVLQGDLHDETFLTKALSGAEIYFFLPPPDAQSADMIEEYRQLAVVSHDAAKTAGVQRIVHLSTLGAHLDREETGLIRGQHIAESIIAEAAANVLHLRCALFLDNYFMSLPTIKDHGAIYFPVSGDRSFAFTSTLNIAEAVRDVLETPTWSGHSVIELHGVRDYSFDEVATEIGQGLGLEVSHIAVPAEAAQEAMQAMGLSEAYARDLVKIFTSIDSGILQPEFDSNDPKVRQTGLTPRAFAQKFLQAAL